MKKKEVQKRILKNGKPLSLKDFIWCKKTNTLVTNEDYLTFNFSDINEINFTSGSNCIFITGSYCTFKTEHRCTFKTGHGCKFITSHSCVFDTYAYCEFDTDSYCTFDVPCSCVFRVNDYCVIIKRASLEVIQPKKDQVIKLFGKQIKGYLYSYDNNTFYYSLDHNNSEYILVDEMLYKIISEDINDNLIIYTVNKFKTNTEGYVTYDGLNYVYFDSKKELKKLNL